MSVTLKEKNFLQVLAKLNEVVFHYCYVVSYDNILCHASQSRSIAVKLRVTLRHTVLKNILVSDVILFTEYSELN